tara:strand:+ start:155 stop:673 length:519 start_codon:yes stop_codon:yes gene_type:complete
MGLFGPSQQEKELLAKETAERLELEKEILKTVKITTGDIKQNYDIVKIVSQLANDRGGLLASASVELAFDHAETKLKIKAAELNCDYVVNTVFNHRIAIGGSKSRPTQVIEVLAYGTAVKTKNASNISRYDNPNHAQVIKENNVDADSNNWVCDKCHEKIDGNFDSCWNCSS